MTERLLDALENIIDPPLADEPPASFVEALAVSTTKLIDAASLDPSLIAQEVSERERAYIEAACRAIVHQAAKLARDEFGTQPHKACGESIAERIEGLCG